nr:acyl-CoA thioesterase [Oceanococcus sp. HetDA_MAG_MS8]
MSTSTHTSSDEAALAEQVYMVFPNDLNAHGTVFGGLIMAQMDRYAAVLADRHAQSTCVTASVDELHFIEPATRGDILIFSLAINRAWSSSMEIGVKVEARAHDSVQRRHIVSAYFTFVALDEAGAPRRVPPLRPADGAAQRRYAEAQLRRENRLRHASELKTLRAQTAAD